MKSMDNLSQGAAESKIVSTPLSTRQQTFAVLCLALALRLFVFWIVIAKYPAGWLYTRGIEMGLLAKSLLLGQGLSSPFGAPTGPTAFIAPGYPLLIAAVFRVFGIYTVSSASTIMLLQIAANLLTVWLIMWIARTLFNQRVAFVAGIFWACSLPLIWMPTIFWDTSFAICMLMGLAALVLRFRSRTTLLVWTLLGAYSAILTLLNPAMLLSIMALLGWLAYQARPSQRSHALLAAVAFVLVFSPWPIRNARVFHAFIPLRTTVGFELWMGNHENSSGFLEENLFPMYNRTELDEYKRVGEVAYTQDKSQLARIYIRNHPASFLQLTVRRFIRFWLGMGTKNGSALFILHAILTSFFGIAGLWILYKRHKLDIAWFFTMPLFLFPLPYYITHAEFRYRLAVDPLLTILAAYALVVLCTKPLTNEHQQPTELRGWNGSRKC